MFLNHRLLSQKGYQIFKSQFQYKQLQNNLCCRYLRQLRRQNHEFQLNTISDDQSQQQFEQGSHATKQQSVHEINRQQQQQQFQQSQPWVLSWQLNERNTDWTEENKIRLMKVLAENELELSGEELDNRVQQLVDIVPGIQQKIFRLKHKLLVKLLRDLNNIAEVMVGLKSMLSGIDVAQLACIYPQLLLQPLEDTKQKWQEVNGWHKERYQITIWIDVYELVQSCPWLLDASVQADVRGEVDQAFEMAQNAQFNVGNNLGEIVRTDVQVGGSDTWDPDTQSYRD
eukprot:TRINITY_DN10246_c0_g2_i1.p2 TRINITY_DN10246_c0_g2~~TRINITY_DN10246_c0_g2_i1.p2  ORF type:complete len:305 (-),score=19.96 TRINITY_DN10246_c0_g2_i1:677-1531(-)